LNELEECDVSKFARGSERHEEYSTVSALKPQRPQITFASEPHSVHSLGHYVRERMLILALRSRSLLN